jgi:transcriptional regulator with XRE-family HTH domain
MTDRMTIVLRDLRQHSGFSQKDLADRSGLGWRTISSYETGQRVGTIKVKHLLAIVAACDIDASEFFRRMERL